MAEREKWRFDVRSSLLTLVVVGLGGTGYHFWKEASTVTPPAKRAPDLERLAGLAVGTHGTVRDPMRGGVFMGRSRDDYEALSSAQDNQDDLGLREIVASGHGFRLTNGNAAELLGKDPLGAVKLRVLGGDHDGEEAWADGGFFNPDPNGPVTPDPTAAPTNGGYAAPAGGP